MARCDTLLIYEALNCQCMWQGDGACSDVMMVKHACSKQMVVFFVIASHKRKREKVEWSLSPPESQPHISDKRLITYIGHHR